MDTRFNSLPRESRVKVMSRLDELVEEEIHEQAGLTLGELYVETMEAIMKNPIRNNTRQRDGVYARAVVSYCLYEQGLTVEKIGAVLGKDHSTITHYRRLVEDALETPASNPEMIILYRKFLKEIQ